MKKKPQASSTCSHSADRVKILFLKGKDLLSHLISKEKAKGQGLRYILVEFPKLSEILNTLSNHVLREELKKSKGTSTSKPSIKHSNLVFVSEPKSFLKPSLFNAHASLSPKSDPDEPSGANQALELDPKRVKGWNLKEYLLAARKLKELRKQQKHSHSSKRYDITLLQKEASGIKESDLEQYEQWNEIIKAKEERHFQITRVIKYLVD
ncbi:MAG TPA: hypothetical protein VLE96_00300 [Chlamydiales bacterium]|nr:hypothetical protein [Chlamydiales bacterium]